jgi:hypothetical protein
MNNNQENRFASTSLTQPDSSTVPGFQTSKTGKNTITFQRRDYGWLIYISSPKKVLIPESKALLE